MTEFDSVIPAGESGSLTVRIKTKSTQSGPVSKSVAVTTDSPGAERMSLIVRFTAASAIRVLPRAQASLTGIEGDEPTATLVLRRGDGKTLEITGIENQDERISISTEPVVKPRTIGRVQAEPGDVLLKLSTVSGLEAVSANGRFTITTNHPDAEPVQIAFGIRLRPTIEIRPARPRLVLQDGNESARTMLLKIQHNRSEKFRITAVEASKPEVFEARLLDGDISQQVHTVALMLLEDVEPGDLSGPIFETLSFATDTEAVTTIDVPVYIEPRELRRPAGRRPTQ